MNLLYAIAKTEEINTEQTEITEQTEDDSKMSFLPFVSLFPFIPSSFFDLA